MKTLYLLCGMPFSGKTILAKSVAEHLHCVYISLDEINEQRGLKGGDGIPAKKLGQDKVWPVQYDRAWL